MAVGSSFEDRYSDLTRPVKAGVTVTPVTPVSIDSTGYFYLEACATGADVQPAMGFPETSGAGTKVEGTGIFTHVLANSQGKRYDSAWSWNIGQPIYLHRTTAGGLTQTAPNILGDMLQQVGIASAENELVIQIGQAHWVGS